MRPRERNGGLACYTAVNRNVWELCCLPKNKQHSTYPSEAGQREVSRLQSNTPFRSPHSAFGAVRSLTCARYGVKLGVLPQTLPKGFTLWKPAKGYAPLTPHFSLSYSTPFFRIMHAYSDRSPVAMHAYALRARS